MLNKLQIIEAIQQINQSARREWLDLFDAGALRRYLDHLQWMLEPRSGNSIWVRDEQSAATMTRQPID